MVLFIELRMTLGGLLDNIQDCRKTDIESDEIEMEHEFEAVYHYVNNCIGEMTVGDDQFQELKRYMSERSFERMMYHLAEGTYIDLDELAEAIQQKD